jgi:hypothetical protein
MGGLFGFGNKKEVNELPPEPKSAKPFTVSFGRGESAFSPKTVGAYGLTPLGRQSVHNLSDNDPNFLVMASIEENGPLTLGQIAEKINMSNVKVNQIVNGRYGLVAGGFVKRVGTGGE